MLQIGDSIRTMRLENNLTQKEMADKLHISFQTVSKWELDKSYPSLETIISISVLFNTSVDSIIFGQNASPTQIQNGNNFSNKITQSFNKKNSNINSLGYKKINHSLDENDLFKQNGTYIYLYPITDFYAHDLTTNWILSINDDYFLELATIKSKSLHKVRFEDIDHISLSLAKTFLGTAPGIFFTTRIMLEITITCKELDKSIVLISKNISIFRDILNFFRDIKIKCFDNFNLSKELDDISSDGINELINERFDILLKKSKTKKVNFYQN